MASQDEPVQRLFKLSLAREMRASVVSILAGNCDDLDRRSRVPDDGIALGLVPGARTAGRNAVSPWADHLDSLPWLDHSRLCVPPAAPAQLTGHDRLASNGWRIAAARHRCDSGHLPRCQFDD